LGKVRDLYEVDDDHLLLVASDQQVREPTPAVGGREGDLDRLGLEVAEDA
jgi:hypothetical protein